MRPLLKRNVSFEIYKITLPMFGFLEEGRIIIKLGNQ